MFKALIIGCVIAVLLYGTYMVGLCMGEKNVITREEALAVCEDTQKICNEVKSVCQKQAECPEPMKCPICETKSCNVELPKPLEGGVTENLAATFYIGNTQVAVFNAAGIQHDDEAWDPTEEKADCPLDHQTCKLTDKQNELLDKLKLNQKQDGKSPREGAYRRLVVFAQPSILHNNRLYCPVAVDVPPDGKTPPSIEEFPKLKNGDSPTAYAKFYGEPIVKGKIVGLLNSSECGGDLGEVRIEKGINLLPAGASTSFENGCECGGSTMLMPGITFDQVAEKVSYMDCTPEQRAAIDSKPIKKPSCGAGTHVPLCNEHNEYAAWEYRVGEVKGGAWITFSSGL